MIKKQLTILKKKIPPLVWFFMAALSFIVAVLQVCLAFELGGAHFKAAFEFVTGGFKDLQLLALAVIATAFGGLSTYYFKASYKFYREALKP